MNPNQTYSPIPTPSPLPTRSGKHVALTIVLIISILLSFGFVGWKWFSNQNETRILEAQNAAMQAEFAKSTQGGVAIDSSSVPSSDQASASRSIESGDVLDSDMSLILNSLSEDDLKSIDQEF